MADQEQLDDFLEALETAGSPAVNGLLRQALGWPQDQYEAVKAELVARKIVVRGRGRGDTVSLVGAEPVAKAAAPATAAAGNGRKSKPAGGGSANLGFEAKLWLTADKLRNNMDAAEYKHVVLGLIFLKYISDSFEEQRSKLLAGEGDYEGANPEDPDEYKAENVFWVPTDARWSHRSVDLLRRVYEYFLTRFASAEGKNGGQFYTPSCVVRCLVEMLEPYKGRIYDPCCGSGGMFVQSEKFVESHGGKLGDISIYGQESNATTRCLAVLTPGRYVGAEEVEGDGEPFEEKMPRLVAVLDAQFAESAKLEAAIRVNLKNFGFIL